MYKLEFILKDILYYQDVFINLKSITLKLDKDIKKIECKYTYSFELIDDVLHLLIYVHNINNDEYLGYLIDDGYCISNIDMEICNTTNTIKYEFLEIKSFEVPNFNIIDELKEKLLLGCISNNEIASIFPYFNCLNPNSYTKLRDDLVKYIYEHKDIKVVLIPVLNTRYKTISDFKYLEIINDIITNYLPNVYFVLVPVLALNEDRYNNLFILNNSFFNKYSYNTFYHNINAFYQQCLNSVITNICSKSKYSIHIGQNLRVKNQLSPFFDYITNKVDNNINLFI